MIDEKLKSDISSIATNSQELLSRCISSLDEIDRANAKAIADIKAQTNSLVKTFSTNLIFNVGATQEYKDLDDAIKECLKYKNLNTKITIVLKDFVFSRQYKYSNLDLSHVTITSENQSIQATYNNAKPLTYILDFVNSYAPEFQDFILNIVNNVSFIVLTNSSLILTNCEFLGGFSIVRAYSDSFFRASNLRISNSAESLYASENSRANILASKFINISKFAICSSRMSPILISNCSFTSCMLCVNLWNRGIVFCELLTKDTSVLCNVASNTMTANGIIYE